MASSGNVALPADSADALKLEDRPVPLAEPGISDSRLSIEPHTDTIASPLTGRTESGASCAGCGLAKTGRELAEPEGSEAPKTAVDRLFQGERMYRAEDEHFTIDPVTLNDIGVFKEDFGLYDQWNKTHTAWGALRLKGLMRNPLLDAAAIRKRQDAVEALRSDKALRETVSAEIHALAATSDDTMSYHYFKGDQKPVKFAIAIAVGIMPAVFLAAYFFGSREVFTIATGLAQVWLMGLIYNLERLPDLRTNLRRYKSAALAAERLVAPLEASSSEALREIGAAFRAAQSVPLVNRFKRLLPGWITGIPGLFYGHNAWTLGSLNRDFRAHRDALTPLLGALGELDVHLSFAEISEQGHKHGDHARPEALDGEEPFIEAVEAHHPLLVSKDRSVPNDILLTLRLEKGKNFLILTGPNTGGKSTYLRALVLDLLLAQIGAWGPWRSLRWRPTVFMSSIDISDSLESDKSFFIAEALRIKEMMAQALRHKRFLGVFDEIWLGTNTVERTGAEMGTIEHLAGSGQTFVLATHDRKMTALEGRVPGVGNIHVEEEHMEDGGMTLTHRVLPGPAKSRNAIKIMKLLGFPSQVTDIADSYVREHPED